MQHAGGAAAVPPHGGAAPGAAGRPSARAAAGWLALAGAALLVAPACHTSTPLSDELQQRIDEEAAGLPSIEDQDAVRATGGAVVAGSLALPEAVALPAEASLPAYVELALARNPGIRARVRELEALGLRVPQVTSWKDPSLVVMPPVIHRVQTAGGAVNGTLGVSQEIPLPAKLRSKGKIAEQVVRVALENLRSERLAVVSAVKKAYFAYYLAHVSLDVTDENLRLLEHLRSVAEAKYKAGNAPQQDLLRAEVELYDVTNEKITLAQEQETAVARLNVLMDRDVTAPIPAPPAIEPRKLGDAIRTLLDRAVEDNPELAAMREETGADLEAVHLARLQYLPDFGLGAALTLISSGGLSAVANGLDVLTLNLASTLPIQRERIRAGVLEQNARVLASAERYRGARNDVLFAIQDLFVKVDAAYRKAVLLRDGILPRARQTVAVSQSGYQAGEVDFTTLIDNWQRLLDLTLGYHRALTTLEQEVADLEQVLGSGLERAVPEK